MKVVRVELLPQGKNRTLQMHQTQLWGSYRSALNSIDVCFLLPLLELNALKSVHLLKGGNHSSWEGLKD